MLPSSLLHFASFFTDSRISKSGWKMLEIILVSFAGWNRYERMNAVLAAMSRHILIWQALCKNKTHQLKANSKHLALVQSYTAATVPPMQKCIHGCRSAALSLCKSLTSSKHAVDAYQQGPATRCCEKKIPSRAISAA